MKAPPPVPPHNPPSYEPRAAPSPHVLDNLYRSEPIFILSTGTSLRGLAFERLNGRITIGINRIVEHYHPTVLHFIDVTAHKTHARALRRFNGTLITGPGAAPNEGLDNSFEINPWDYRPPGPIGEANAIRLFKANRPEVGRSFNDGLFGLGAGCTALHTAILLGGDPIYLLGYDYYEENGRHFDTYDESLNGGGVYDFSAECIQEIASQPWRPAIFNCNPKSRLRCFPHRSLEAALSET